jgi:hypothetical protein
LNASPSIHPTSALQASLGGFLPITKFNSFHRDPNINYQLNRFLIPGEEVLFAELGTRIEHFDDWKREFLAAADLSEQRGAPRCFAPPNSS